MLPLPLQYRETLPTCHNLSPTAILHNSSPTCKLFSCTLAPHVFVFLSVIPISPLHKLAQSVTFHLQPLMFLFCPQNFFYVQSFFFHFLPFPLVCCPSLLSPPVCASLFQCFRPIQGWTVKYLWVQWQNTALCHCHKVISVQTIVHSGQIITHIQCSGKICQCHLYSTSSQQNRLMTLNMWSSCEPNSFIIR